MKQMVTKFVGILILVGALGAQAAYIPGWDRPVEKATLTEIDTTGHELGIGLEKTLTLHKMDNAQQSATSFTFAEEMKVICKMAPCNPIPMVAKFRVVRVSQDRCGSTVYTAQEIVKAGRDSESDPFLRSLRVVDHSTRLCEDYRPFRWEAELTAVGNASNVRNFQGNPEPVYTIQ